MAIASGRERARRSLSFGALVLASIGLVATSYAPDDTTLETLLEIPIERFENGDVQLFVAMNGSAASYPEPDQPLTVAFRIPSAAFDRKSSDASLALPGGREVRLRAVEVEGEPIIELKPAWVPEVCRHACLRSARLSVSGLKSGPSAIVEVRASVVFDVGEDSEPDGSALVLAIAEDPPWVASSNTVGDFFPAHGVLLTPDQPFGSEALRLEMDRSAIPHLEPSATTVELAWRGGAMHTVSAGEATSARITFRPPGYEPVVVPVEGDLDIRDGTADVRFEVPFRVTCDPDRCSTMFEVEMALVEGSWVFIDWSNYIPGIRTVEGDQWVHPWRIRPSSAP